MLNKTRFLRLVGFGLIVEVVLIATFVVLPVVPAPALVSDVLPTQMVLPVASTPVPSSPVITRESSQTLMDNVLAVEPSVEYDEMPLEAVAIAPTSDQPQPVIERRPSQIHYGIEPQLEDSQAIEPVPLVQQNPTLYPTVPTVPDAGQPSVNKGEGVTFGEQGRIAPPNNQVPNTPSNDGNNRINPLAVIGPDTRSRINPTNVVPNSAIVQIEFYSNGSPYVCSGAMINSSYVLTAAHCVFNDGVYSNPIYVTPARNSPSTLPNAQQPFGSVSATIDYVPPAWVASNTAACGFACANVDFDWAILKLDTDFSTSIEPFALSAFPDSQLIDFNSSGGYKNAGYPADKCYYGPNLITTCPASGPDAPNGVTQWGASGTIIPSLSGPNLLASQIDTFGGQSGSPLWYRDGNSRPIITGILSFSFNTNPNWQNDFCETTPGQSCQPQYVNNYFRRVTTQMLDVLVTRDIPHYNPNCYPLIINQPPQGRIEQLLPRSPGCRLYTYSNGTVLNLSIAVDPGYVLAGWTGGPTGNVNTTFTINGQMTISANLVPQPAPAPASILQAGFYDERDSRITYSDKWVPFNGVGPSANTLQVTNFKNEIIQFAYSGSGVVIYRRRDSNRGPMQVCVDTTCQTITNSNPTIQWQVPAQFMSVNAVHNVRIRNLSSALIDLDAIQIIQPIVQLTPNTYQETHPNITYIGRWTQDTNPNALGGGRKYTNDPFGKSLFYADDTVGRIVVYRTSYQSGAYGPLQMKVAQTLYTIPNIPSSTYQYGVPYTVELNPPGGYEIELSNIGTTYSDIDQITLLPPAAYLGVGTYQENNSELSYTGNWISTSSTLGGARRYTKDPNAWMRFRVNNTVGRVTIYRTTAGNTFGTLQVYIDGALKFTIPNNTSGTVQYGVPFTFDLNPGNYKIELRNVGSTFSDIDQIVLEASPAPLTLGTYQESNPNLSFLGNWTTVTNSGLGGSRKYTKDANGFVRFRVDSAVGRVTIYRTVASTNWGSMQVFVDGHLRGMIVNNTSPTVQYGVPYTFTFPPGNHTIELRNVGSAFSDIDQIMLEAPSAALGVGTYQETQPQLIYTDQWTPIAHAGALGGTRTYTKGGFSWVSFNINSSVGRVTIYRTIALNASWGTMPVYVDGLLIGTMVNNASPSVHYGVPYSFNVTPGNHLIEIRNVNAGFGDIDQVTLLPAAVPLAIGTYEETHDQLTYSGVWTQIATGGLGGGRRYAADTTASVFFSIDNTVGSVTIYRTIAGDTFSNQRVFVDGVGYTTLSNNNNGSTVQYGVPHTFSVTPGNHVIEIRNVDGRFADIDRIVLQAPGSASLPVILTLRPTLEPTPTPTATLEVTATLDTSTVIGTETATLQATQTMEPKATKTDVSTPTAVPTEIPSSTLIPTEVPTQTPVPSSTLLPTELPTQTPVPTSTPLPTDVPTSTPMPTDLPTSEPSS